MSQFKCSHCLKPGHRINKCDDPTKLCQQIMDIGTFCLYSCVNGKFMKAWLKTLEINELRIIGYRSNIAKIITNNLSRDEYYTILYDIYYKNRIIYETNRETHEKFEEITDERLSVMSEKLIQLFPIDADNVPAFINRLRPPQRTFPIVPILSFEYQENKESCSCPICYEDTDFEKIIKTNCKHLFCTPCFKNYFKSFNKESDDKIITCPMCRTNIDTLEFSDFNIFNEFITKFCK